MKGLHIEACNFWSKDPVLYSLNTEQNENLEHLDETILEYIQETSLLRFKRFDLTLKEAVKKDDLDEDESNKDDQDGKDPTQ